MPVFCVFRHDIQSIKHAATEAGRKAYELSGKKNELQEWQQSKEGDVLAVQIRSGALGIDFTRAKYCAYYSLGFSLGDYSQSLKRVHRQGQKRRVTYFHFISQNTVDEKVYRALQSKADVVRTIVEGIRQPIMKG